jgi:hypothetical protein
MNLGLGNLITLKQHLLTDALVTSTTWNKTIERIGKGVAAQLERFCNRQFARTVDDTFTFAANCQEQVLPRFPIESISAIAQQTTETEGFVALDLDVITQIRKKSGLIQFGAVQGSYLSQLRVTYTGGYWFDDSEEDSGEQPDGSTALPDDLKLAWLEQSKAVWNQDPLRTGISKEPEKQAKVEMVKLTEQVREILLPLRRFS